MMRIIMIMRFHFIRIYLYLLRKSNYLILILIRNNTLYKGVFHDKKPEFPNPNTVFYEYSNKTDYFDNINV